MEFNEQPNAAAKFDPFFASIFGFTFRQNALLQRENERLQHLSTHDGLTSLYNRLFFDEEMVRFQVGRSYPISIVGADADGLKIVNDTLGHTAGDQLLKDTAEILKLVFRGDDVIARTGGDEFNVILPNTGRAELGMIMKRLRRMIRIYNRENHTNVSLSVGGATAETASTSLLDVMEKADQVMYKRKKSKKEGRSEPLKIA